MANENNIALSTDDPTLGKIEINPSVLEIIAGLATAEVDGVNRMSSSLTSSVTEWLGKSEPSKGVRLSYNDQGELVVDIFVYLNYGVSVPQVALKIQDQVKQQLLFMTELQLSEVNVHVLGIVPEKTKTAIDPNNPFADEKNGDQ